MLMIEHPSLAKVLKTAFSAVWERGITFDEAYDRFVVRQKKTA